MYKVLSFFAQPFACLLVREVAASICKDNHKICVLTNCIVGACACVVFAFFASATSQFFAMLISAAACIYTAVAEARDVAPKKTSGLESGKSNAREQKDR